MTAASLPPLIINEITPALLEMAGDKGSELGTGGMKTKLHAGSICMEKGCEMVIASGANPQVLYDIVSGKEVGTRFKKSKYVYHGRVE